MAQDISKLNNGGKSAPEKKQVAKIDAHAHKKLLWSNISKKFLLPASILFLAAGLFLTVFYVLQLLQVIPQSEAMTLGMKISSIVLGVFLIVTGVFGLMKKHKKLTMAFDVMALVYAIILLTATVKAGAVAIASGITVIVLGIFFAIAVDGMFDLGLIRFFREMNGEVKKLTWLTRKELASHTLAVLVFVLAMAALIYLLDLAFSSGFSAIGSINLG
ncbi:MAG TPA: preprotein translocase subunit SecE [Clostridia bacterium]|jgi:preprotein translocase SecE subunit|nr:preprotein translocase subunit SecE [Clostridia bacterium]